MGNLNPGEQDELFATLAGALRPDDHVLLGLDLVKDPAVLDAAYNDAPASPPSSRRTCSCA
jgi:L-histidine N-alpha-methyltransferase